MPGEIATASSHPVSSITPKSLKSRNVSTASSASHMSKLADGCAKEFFWGCELTKDKKETTWTFEEEEDDQDFLVHTLFLRHVVLGSNADTDEKNVLEIETTGFSGETVKQPIAVVWKGHDMCQLDLNFSHEIPVTFRLSEGNGPLYLSAQHLVEFPQEMNESEYTATEEEFTDASDEEISPTKGTKRKAGSLGAAKKKGKLDNVNLAEEDDDEEEEDEEEEEEDSMGEDASMEEDEEDDSEEEVESSPEKPVKKGKKGKATAPVAKATKKEKAAPVVAKGKKGKKGKAK